MTGSRFCVSIPPNWFVLSESCVKKERKEVGGDLLSRKESILQEMDKRRATCKNGT